MDTDNVINSLLNESNILLQLENYFDVDKVACATIYMPMTTDYYHYFYDGRNYNEVNCSVSLNDNESEHPLFEIGYGNLTNNDQVILTSNGILKDKRTIPETSYQITRPFKKVTLYLDNNDKMVIVLGRDDNDNTKPEFKIATNVTIDKLAAPFIKLPEGKSYKLNTSFEEIDYSNLTGYIAGSNGINSDTPCKTGCFINTKLDKENDTCVTPLHGTFFSSEWDHCDKTNKDVAARKAVIQEWNKKNSTKKVAI